MQKSKENLFLDKFRLLNSQEHSEEINWSTSDSSDYENTSINEQSFSKHNRSMNMKRKRKRKVPKNISNLSITILDTSTNSKKVFRSEKSPILCSRSRQKSVSLSPILKCSQAIPRNNTASSPILTSKICSEKSPILISKTESPKCAVKVRKKLFNIGNIEKKSIINTNHTYAKHEDLNTTLSVKKEVDTDFDLITGQSNGCNNIISGCSQKAKQELVERVKSFFDSHFSPDNTPIPSQNSISDCLTPKDSSKTSDEIEILSCKSQIDINNRPKNQENIDCTENSPHINKNKKFRYKKDGLAYRLNNLLKKQNACLSLWQHERFLAANSNFVIPKGECTVFRIQRVHFKYGCHSIEAVDLYEEKYVILINSIYTSINIVSDTILTLYEPYTVLPLNDCKLIINVCKFENSKLS